jgi:cell division protein FtsW
MAKARTSPDPWLIAATMAILAIGLVMVYSASAVLSFREFGDSFYYLKRQAIFAGLGIAAMIVTMNTDYWVWKKVARAALIVCFALLVIVLIPGVGVIRGGARSWLGIGSLGIQPSEFMKLGMIMFLAKLLSEERRDITSFGRGLLPALGLMGLAFGMIMLQPDLGTGVVLVGASMMIIFAAGARLSHLGVLALVGVAGFVPLGAGYQSIQSLFAIGPGGLAGLGLGRSLQKYSYLPEPQTDFIFSILAEETGFIGGGLLIVLFMLLVWRGMRTAITAPDSFGSLLAIGIVGMVAVQVIINVGVVIGMFPVTGITLPLVSYGGSSLTLMLTALGVLFNISRYAR